MTGMGRFIVQHLLAKHAIPILEGTRTQAWQHQTSCPNTYMQLKSPACVMFGLTRGEASSALAS